MSSKRSLILLDAAVIAAPLFMALVVRSLMTPAASMGGTAASPYDTVGPGAVAAAPQKPLSPEQLKAKEWIASIGSRSGLASPMDHPTPVVVVQATEAPKPDPSASLGEQIAALKLSAVMGSNARGLATINGKVYRVGQTVLPGVTLSQIDPKTNSIVLKAANGTEYTITRHQ